MSRNEVYTTFETNANAPSLLLVALATPPATLKE
jgi:hypothetical protein